MSLKPQPTASAGQKPVITHPFNWGAQKGDEAPKGDVSVRLSVCSPVLFRWRNEFHGESVSLLADADMLQFNCPKCLGKEDEHGFVHVYRIPFDGPRFVRTESRPLAWAMSGSSLEDISLDGSIRDLDSCKWHGFLRAGKVVDA